MVAEPTGMYVGRSTVIYKWSLRAELIVFESNRNSTEKEVNADTFTLLIQRIN